MTWRIPETRSLILQTLCNGPNQRIQRIADGHGILIYLRKWQHDTKKKKIIKNLSHFLLRQPYLKDEISGKNYQDFLPFSSCLSPRLIMAIKKFSDKAEQNSQKAAI